MSKPKEAILLTSAVLSALTSVAVLLKSFVFLFARVEMTPSSGLGAALAVLLSVVPAVAAFYFWKALRAERTKVDTSSALEVLKSQCGGVLHRYKHLDHDYRDQVRYPLNSNSWPAYETPWSYVHVELVLQKRQLDMVVALSKSLWSRMNWQADRVEMFSLNESTKMLDLISALEDFLAIDPRPAKR